MINQSLHQSHQGKSLLLITFYFLKNTNFLNIFSLNNPKKILISYTKLFEDTEENHDMTDISSTSRLKGRLKC